MATFVLQRCQMRADRIVVTTTPPETLTWADLCDRFAPPPIQTTQRVLRQLAPEGYVGLLRNKQKRLEPFFVRSPDRSNQIGWLLKQQPLFAKQLEVVYRVLSVDWGGGVIEK